MGDYYGALETLDQIDLDHFKRNSKGELPQANLSYYTGFAYLMLRRYSDAVDVLSDFISTYSRKRLDHTGKEDAVKKMVARVSGVLALSLGMYPQTLEEGVASVVREMYGDKLQRMQRSDVVAFEETFEEVCPKFVSASVPDYSGAMPENAGKVQLRLFITEVRQRMSLPELTSYLKLCTAVDTAKLAGLANKDKDALIADLLSSKIICKNLKHPGGAAPVSAGELTSMAPVGFYIKNDVIHVAQSKEVERHGDYFIGEILKYEDMAFNVRRIGR